MSAASPTPSAKSTFLKIAGLLLIYCVATAMAASAQNLTTLVSFDVTNGQNPYFETLVQGADGNLYGTTYEGGANNEGTVFQVNPSTGVLTTLHNFAGPPNDGRNPTAGLVLASDGNFYGTTNGGGANTWGTVFKITPGGTLTLLHSFAVVDGSQPWSGLVQGTDGNLYGTTTFGGSNEIGTIFKITTGGTLTTLYNFAEADGAIPYASLIQGTDGNLYGTASNGGTNNDGTVFKITTGGTVTLLHSFTNTDGAHPYGRLVQATDGTFYGTTVQGGSSSVGTVFKITSSGTLTTLHNFDGTTASNPFAGLIQAADGSFYGTTATIPTIFRITSQGTLSTVYSFPVSDAPYGGLLQSNGVFYGTTFSGGTSGAGSVYSLSPGQYLVPVTPCRLVDTRGPDGPFGGPAIPGNTARSFNLPQNTNCNIPVSAAAYSLNVTVVPHGTLGYLTIWPTGQNQPQVSTMNSPDGRVKANAAIVPAGLGGPISVYVTDTTDVVLDIDGYFATTGTQTLQFYPLTPCRVVDTRTGSQQPQGLGPPRLHDMETRPLPILTSPCLQGISHPLAYSFNVTVSPNPVGQPLGYVTVWPSNEPQPVVSTLNNPTATVVANAAIVPAASNGDIDIFAFNSTDVVVDINGYFAAPGQNGFYFYKLTPCRVYDSRNQGDGQPFQGERTVSVAGSQCAPPNTAQGYVFNATVIPADGPMPYLTLWPDTETMPIVSTLNAYDGFITSNMAIVPNLNGSLDAYAAGLTHLVLDISGYFGP